MKISIIPDTNVLISNLDVIIGLMDSPLPEGSTICVSRIVLRELDKLKTRSQGARAATRFLLAVANSIKMQIEGIENINRMESENESAGEIVAENNDDQIINYIFRQENAVFLTNDKALALRCKTYGIIVLEVGQQKTKSLFSEIMRLFSVELPSNAPQQPESINDLKNAVLEAISPRIRDIAFNELGSEYDIIMDRYVTLEDYLSEVSRNFFMFKKYLPARSNKIITNFLRDLKNNTKPAEMIEKAEVICSLFQSRLIIK